MNNSNQNSAMTVQSNRNGTILFLETFGWFEGYLRHLEDCCCIVLCIWLLIVRGLNNRTRGSQCIADLTSSLQDMPTTDLLCKEQ